METNGGIFRAVFVFAYFAVQFERTHVHCYEFKYLKSVMGGITAGREERESQVDSTDAMPAIWQSS